MSEEELNVDTSARGLHIILVSELLLKFMDTISENCTRSNSFQAASDKLYGVSLTTSLGQGKVSILVCEIEMKSSH